MNGVEARIFKSSELNWHGGSKSTSRGRRRELKARKREKTRTRVDDYSTTETSGQIIYKPGPCKVRKRNTENIETKCNIRADRATLSTGNVLGRKTSWRETKRVREDERKRMREGTQDDRV